MAIGNFGNTPLDPRAVSRPTGGKPEASAAPTVATPTLAGDTYTSARPPARVLAPASKPAVSKSALDLEAGGRLVGYGFVGLLGAGALALSSLGLLPVLAVPIAAGSVISAAMGGMQMLQGYIEGVELTQQQVAEDLPPGLR